MPDGRYRRLNCSEMELLQGLPLGYTEGVRDSARVHAIGNGWHVPTIEFIFQNLL